MIAFYNIGDLFSHMTGNPLEYSPIHTLSPQILFYHPRIFIFLIIRNRNSDKDREREREREQK